MTKNEFIARAVVVHDDFYNYGLTDYISSLLKVVIVCPAHGPFQQKPTIHLRGHGCKKCASEINGSRSVKTTAEFVMDASKKHGNRYLYENAEYVGHRKKLLITCIEHGDFPQTPDAHLIGGQGCPECAKTSRMLSNRKFTKDDFIKSAIEIHGDLYDYSKVSYINIKTKVQVWCKKHAYFFWTVPEIHLRVKCGCPKCGSDRTAAAKVKTPEQFIIDAKELYGDTYDYRDTCYNGYYEKITVHCSNRKHGSFEVTAGGHLSGIGCPRCNKNVSKQEEKFLDLIGILPENRQIKIGRYKVDGLEPETKTIWEFDGDFWHGNPALYDQTTLNPRNKETFGELYNKTLKKRASLEKMGYTVRGLSP